MHLEIFKEFYNKILYKYNFTMIGTFNYMFWKGYANDNVDSRIIPLIVVSDPDLISIQNDIATQTSFNHDGFRIGQRSDGLRMDRMAFYKIDNIRSVGIIQTGMGLFTLNISQMLIHHCEGKFDYEFPTEQLQKDLENGIVKFRDFYLDLEGESKVEYEKHKLYQQRRDITIRSTNELETFFQILNVIPDIKFDAVNMLDAIGFNELASNREMYDGEMLMTTVLSRIFIINKPGQCLKNSQINALRYLEEYMLGDYESFYENKQIKPRFKCDAIDDKIFDAMSLEMKVLLRCHDYIPYSDSKLLEVDELIANEYPQLILINPHVKDEDEFDII